MVLRIGHRGAMGHVAENTLASFKKALELDVDMVELDVHIAQSGEVLVFHDFRLKRLTGKKGYIAHTTFQNLKKLRVKGKHKIPTLTQVLDLLDKRVQVNIELKGLHTAIAVHSILEKYVKKGWRRDQFLISSFNSDELEIFSTLSLSYKIGVLFGPRARTNIRYAAKLGAFSLHLNLRKVKKRIVDRAHSKGLKVFVWTVNDPKDIEFVKECGVDGIISNYPERI